MINFDYSKPLSVNAAARAMASGKHAAFIAGGTNIVDLMKRSVLTPQKLVDITGLPLDRIEKKGDTLYIGALVKNSAIAENAMVLQQYPLLAMAINAGASPQLRNMATTGGNIMQRTRCTYFYDNALPCNKRSPGTGCAALQGYNRMHAVFGASEHCIAVHPSDMCVGLAALDTTVLVNNGKQERRIPFTSFHRLPGDQPQKDNNLEPGELITGIEIGRSGFGNNVHYLKIRDRASYAFALVSVAIAMELDNNTIKDIRIALGGVAHKPWRMSAAEDHLKGKQPLAEHFTEAVQKGMSGAHTYGRNDFKLKLVPRAVMQALQLAVK